ncbi:MAG: S8 family serine peptidase, partial [Bdellovibrionales bacterium]|nr:S8 family serine peptidase [Bdellovibrionales bacterium]
MRLQKKNILNSTFVASVILLGAFGFAVEGDNGLSVPLSESETQTWVVLFKKNPSAERLKGISNSLGLSFDPFIAKDSDYFSRLFSVVGDRSTVSKIPGLESIEKSHEVALMAVQPSKKFPTEDSFSDYQWALDLNDQKVSRDVTNILSRTFDNRAESDLGWSKKRIETIEGKMERDAVVAVIDSGATIDHEDFASDVFFKNEIECEENGKPPIGDAEDKDGNKYAGDCLGWNFTSSNPNTARNVVDRIGHGTFVSGLLAADRDNHQGIAGLSKRIKILPLQVYTDRRDGGRDDSDIQVGKSLTDKVAKAVTYAADRGVDVITMSIGWPNVIETRHVREAFDYASRKGVILVAASGNNDMPFPIFPCAYENVICVGSNSPNGEIAEFSNHGGHVDFVAPGDSILSLYPTLVQQKSFGSTGYEVKSGTSFSAPYVAGIAALLRGTHPNWTSFNVKRALVGMTVDLAPSKRWVQYGLPRLTNWGKLSDRVAPLFKGRNEIRLIGNQGKLRLPLENFGLKSGVNLKVKSGSEGVRVLNDSYSTNGRSDQVLSVPIEVSSLEVESTAVILVEVADPSEGTKTYKNVFQIVRVVAKKDLIQIANWPSVVPDEISPVPEIPTSQATPFLFVTRGDKERVVIQTINTSTDEIATIEIKGNQRSIKTAYFLDLNYDGKKDFLFVGDQLREKGREVVYALLNQDLTPIFEGSESVVLQYENGGFIDPNRYSSLAWIKLDSPFGPTAVPVFDNRGGTPKSDVDPDFVDRVDPRVTGPHFYYFELAAELGKPVYKLRLLDNYLFTENLKAKFNNRLRSEVRLEYNFPQSIAQFRKGSVSLFISKGKRDVRDYFVAELNAGNIEERDFEWAQWNNNSILAHLKLTKPSW